MSLKRVEKTYVAPFSVLHIAVLPPLPSAFFGRALDPFVGIFLVRNHTKSKSFADTKIGLGLFQAIERVDGMQIGEKTVGMLRALSVAGTGPLSRAAGA